MPLIYLCLIFLYSEIISEKVIPSAVHVENANIILSIKTPIIIPIPAPKAIPFAK